MGNPLRSLSQWQMAADRAPYLDESLNGYISYRAAAERLPTSFVITSLADIQYGHRSELVRGANGLDNVADCLQADLSDLQARTYPLHTDGRRRMFFAAPIERTSIEHYTRRFSPTSLHTAPYHRAIWSLRPLPYCSETGELLQDKCPRCGETQRWLHANGIENCDFCGSSLLEAAPIPLPEEICADLYMAAGLIHPDLARRAEAAAQLPEQIRSIGSGPAFDLLVALAGIANPTIRSTRPRRAIRTTAEALPICRAMAPAWAMLKGWPESFERFIADRLAQRRGRFGDGNAGATQDFFEFANAQTIAQPVAQLIERARERVTQNRSTGLDAKETAVVTGLKATHLVNLRRAGHLQAVFHLDGDRPHPLIDKAAAQRLADLLRSSLRIEDAALQLGTSYNGVEQLLCLGYLDSVCPIVDVGGESEIRVCSASLGRFINSIEDKLAAGFGVDAVPLAKALVGIPGLRAWGPILANISRRKFSAYYRSRTGSLVDRILVRRTDIPVLRSIVFNRDRYPNFRFSCTMTKKDAAVALNLQSRHSTPLLASWPSNGGGERTVPVADVERLASAYVSAAELAARLGMNGRAAAAAAERVGLQRASLAGYDRKAVDDLFSR
jgi:hypothetical protein